MKKFLLTLTLVSFGLFSFACDDDDNNNNSTNEICDNQVDDDGDGDIDCDDNDCWDDPACINEICDNEIDDDGDGDVDCDDEDCADAEVCQDILKHVTIIGTADIHSHLMGVGPATDYTPLDNTDEDGTISGLARIASVINDIKATSDASTLLVDSGDCLMGDMIDLLSGTAPPVFHFFKHMNYDAVTLGNHDFDWTPEGTATIITTAQDFNLIQFDIPLLSSNIITDATSTADDGIETLINNGSIVSYVLKPIDDDFTVGIFGKMGIEADKNVPQAKPLTWWHDDPDGGDFSNTQALVDDLKTDGAHMVVHASHQGINANTVGEDQDVAANVDGIDVIMSGHRHQVLDGTYLKIGDTYIVAAGRRGEFVDQMDVTFNLTQEVVEDATGYVHAIDDTIEGDATVAGIMDAYINNLDSEYLIPTFGMTYSATPIAHATYPLRHLGNFYKEIPQGEDIETPSGLLVADAQRTVMNSIVEQAVDGGVLGVNPAYDASPVFMTVAETGAVREPILLSKTGNVAAADAFRVFPLGIGPDGVPGYPMLTFYITLAELKIMLNMNAEVLMGNVPFEYYLQPSGLRFVWDENGAQFDKVVAAYKCPDADPFTMIDCYLPYPEGTGMSVDLEDDTTLVRIGVDYYVALLLPEARNEIGEFLTIDPKYKDGTLVDMENSEEVASLRFDADPTTTDGSGLPTVVELKAWVSLLQYISAFSDDWSELGLHYDEPADGMPSFPSRIYDSAEPPEGEEADWGLGLKRSMELNNLCTTFPTHPHCVTK
ncbi:MAG: bifunctional metallophosphatase/5'-nucleotidase [Myxococcota bacterium]